MKYEPNIKTIELERLYICKAMAMNTTLMGMDIDIRKDILERAVTYQVRGFLWSRSLKRYEVRWPANWKEAVKERWFPEWALRRWPVKYSSKRMELKAVWPTLRMEVPDHQPRLVMLVNNESVASWPPRDIPG
jgi:hypothetical protein